MLNVFLLFFSFFILALPAVLPTGKVVYRGYQSETGPPQPPLGRAARGPARAAEQARNVTGSVLESRKDSSYSNTSPRHGILDIPEVKAEAMSADRAIRSLHAVLPRALDFPTVVEPPAKPGSKFQWDAVVRIAGHKVTVEWLRSGTLPAVQKVLARRPRPDVLVTPRMSEGAKAAASDAGVGWVEETGAAEIALPFLVVSRTAVAKPPTKPKRWRSSHLGVAEALLEGVRPTVSAVAEATGMSASTVTAALAFLSSEGLLVAEAARGRKSARKLDDPAALLDSYTTAVESIPPAAEIQVGILSRDPIRDIARLGQAWTDHNVTWAATSAVAAATLAPFATQVAPLVVYVHADTPPQLASVADLADLSPIRGGRLTLRPFPTKATAKLCTWHDGLSIVPWARCYADLVTTGVRGEDIATNLREMKLSERGRTGPES